MPRVTVYAAPLYFYLLVGLFEQCEHKKSAHLMAKAVKWTPVRLWCSKER